MRDASPALLCLRVTADNTRGAYRQNTTLCCKIRTWSIHDRAANTKHNASIQAEHITQHCIALNTISQYNSYLSTKQHWESSQHKDVRLHAKQSSCIDMENCAHIQWHHPLLQCCWGSKLGSSQLNVLAYQLCYKTNPFCPCVIVSWARQILLSTCRGERGAQRWVLCSLRESAAPPLWMNDRLDTKCAK